VAELGEELTRDYAGREPILVGALKSSVVFLTDLSRALRLPHSIDFVELERYTPGTHASASVRLLKDLDRSLEGEDVIFVEDVVDTGLTLRFLCKTFRLRSPRSLAVVTLLDRPYRRLVDDLPVRYVGFVAPDELFVGYGFDLDERHRALPDLYLVRS
jgi:hypoxanthine phosphoribosyltransferase